MEKETVTSSETRTLRPKRVRVPSETDSRPSRDCRVDGGEKPDRVPSDQSPESDDEEEEAPRSKRRRKRRIPKVPVTFINEDMSLIDIVKSNGKLISHAVKHWVERYEKNPKSALVELLMMLFEACGAAKYHLTEDSLDETDVDDVVVALVELTRNVEVEDYYYSSKRREFKNFKENLVSFWDNLVIECQNGPLFDKVLFEKCMDYVVALSCSPPRVYRQVASLVGLQLVTSFITIAKMLRSQLERETTLRQLNAEKKKRNEGPRMESLNNRLSMTREKITVMEDMMRKMFTGFFMHRYRDIDPNIRTSSIQSLGVWILSYPSLFLQESYSKYLGWALNDKSAGVRKTSVLALQNLYEVYFSKKKNLYEVDDNVPSLGLFTENFSNRMVKLAYDVDVSVAVCAIGLLKQLLRHQLLSDDDLGPLYNLLIDEQPEIRRAIGALVYDHLIAQKFSSSQTGLKGDDNGSSEVHLGRMLQIPRKFSSLKAMMMFGRDPILSTYVIDDVWDYMKAMKDWKCIISMLLDENPLIKLTDVDATNLVRLLYASTRKAVGERIVPATDNRKHTYNKAQKEALENNRRDITVAMMKNYRQLLRKFMADKAKVPALVEIIVHLKLELYSLKRQEQNFKTVLQLIKEAFFKHGEKDPLRCCIKAITFCSTDSQGELQDFAQNKLKELEDELIKKLKSAIKEVAGGDDEYSLLANLKRLYELQLAKSVPIESFYEDFVNLLADYRNMDDKVVSFLLLNMYMHVAWCLRSVIDADKLSDTSLSSLLSKRTILFEQLEYFLDTPPEVREEGTDGRVLACRVIVILAEMWCLFRKSNFSSTKLKNLGFCPETSTLQKYWKLCEQQLNISDETEDKEANKEYNVTDETEDKEANKEYNVTDENKEYNVTDENKDKEANKEYNVTDETEDKEASKEYNVTDETEDKEANKEYNVTDENKEYNVTDETKDKEANKEYNVTDETEDKEANKEYNVTDETKDKEANKEYIEETNRDAVMIEEANREYIEETNRDAVMIAAAKLVASNTVPKDYLGPEIISHFVTHGESVAEIVKHLIAVLKKTTNDDVPNIILEALKRAYQRHVVELSKGDDEPLTSKSFVECKDLAARLSGTYTGARNKHRSDILKIVKDGILFAFEDAPTQLHFLEAVLLFVPKLPTSDILDILKDVQRRTEKVNTDEDPSGWRPYNTFVDHLREKYAKNKGLHDEKEKTSVRRRGPPRKRRNLQGKKLFEEQDSSEDDDSISASDQDAQEEDEQDEEDAPLIHSFRSASKLRSLRVQQQENKIQTRTVDSRTATQEDLSASRTSGASD